MSGMHRVWWLVILKGELMGTFFTKAEATRWAAETWPGATVPRSRY